MLFVIEPRWMGIKFIYLVKKELMKFYPIVFSR